MVFQNTFDAQDTHENLSKPRTVLFKEREDDEPMASQSIFAKKYSPISNRVIGLQLILFICMTWICLYGLVGTYDQFVYVIFIQAIQYFILNIALREDYLPSCPAVASRILSLVQILFRQFPPIKLLLLHTVLGRLN